MKGAAERVLLRCDKIDTGNGILPMTEENRKAINNMNNEYASNGERVLGLAYLDLKSAEYPENINFSAEGPQKNVPTSELVFLGLISLKDPPRDGVEKSVDKCRDAGIKVIMITGDQPETAKSIAHQCHILTNLENEYGALMAKGMSREEAEAKCTVIYIKAN
jgi:sodium/potassium-transporting ATPase subunit alpha